MTGPNEIPEFPADDRMGSRLLTVSTLADEFEGYAYCDDKFRTFEHPIINPSNRWYTNDGAYWRIDFLAQHVYANGEYEGDLYGITLSLSKEIDYLSEDFMDALERIENSEPPDEEKLVELKLTHVSQFILSRSVELGWTNYKVYTSTEHIGDGESGPLYSEKEYNIQEELRLIDTSAKDKNSDDTDQIKEIVKAIADITDESLNEELKDCVVSDAQLKRAHDLFLLFQSGDESSIDVSTIMPKAFLE